MITFSINRPTFIIVNKTTIKKLFENNAILKAKPLELCLNIAKDCDFFKFVLNDYYTADKKASFKNTEETLRINELELESIYLVLKDYVEQILRRPADGLRLSFKEYDNKSLKVKVDL